MALFEVRDVEGAVHFLKGRLGEGLQLALMGHSMGAATVLRAAARRPEVRVTVAIAGYSSLQATVADGIKAFANLPPFPLAPLVVWWCERLTGGKLKDINPLADLDSYGNHPLLLVHGDADKVVRPENSQRLYAQRPQHSRLITLNGAGHNAVLSEAYFEGYKTRLSTFLEVHLGSVPQTAEPSYATRPQTEMPRPETPQLALA